MIHLGIDFWEDVYGFLVKNGGKMAPKSIKNRSKNDQNQKRRPRESQECLSSMSVGVPVPKKAAKASQHNPNLAPKTVPKWFQNRCKNRSKFGYFWGSILERFSSIFGTKMEPSWVQNRSKIHANCEMRFFEKTSSRCSGGSFFEILGVEVGNKNRLKID